MDYSDTNSVEIPDLVRARAHGGPDALALLLKPEEVAELLQVSRSKVYELIRLGLLRSLKIGGSRRITQEALIEFISGLQEAS